MIGAKDEQIATPQSGLEAVLPLHLPLRKSPQVPQTRRTVRSRGEGFAGREIAAIPGWYWWATAVLTIALSAAIESGRGALSWIGIALFTAGTLVISGLLTRALRGARPRRDLVAPGSVPGLLAAIAAFAAAVPGAGLATGLSLKAAGVPWPGTIASVGAMVVFVAGGQMLMRHHTAFLVRRSGDRG